LLLATVEGQCPSNTVLADFTVTTLQSTESSVQFNGYQELGFFGGFGTGNPSTDNLDIRLTPITTDCDFNQDGHLDVIIASPNTNKIHVVYGVRASQLFNLGLVDLANLQTNITAGFVITGKAGSETGWNVVAMDINSDSKCDIMIGAELHQNNFLWVLYGGTTIGSTGLFDLSTLSVHPEYGYVVTDSQDINCTPFLSAIDWNKDGKSDVAIGCPINANYAGEVFIYYGGSNIASLLVNNSLDIRTAVSNGMAIRFYNASASFLGASIDVGDFDGNGRTDLLMGTFGGVVYVVSNLATGSTLTANNNLYHLAPPQLVTFKNSDGYFGFTAYTLGDLNNDTYPDIAIPACSETVGGAANAGKIYIKYMTPSVFANAPVGGYDFASIASRTITAGVAEDYFGVWMVPLGDHDKDGYADFSVSRPLASTNGLHWNGASYIVFGKTLAGLAAGANLDINTVSSSSGLGYVVTGTHSNDSLTMLPYSSDFNGGGLRELFFFDGNAGAGYKGRLSILLSEGPCYPNPCAASCCAHGGAGYGITFTCVDSAALPKTSIQIFAMMLIVLILTFF